MIKCARRFASLSVFTAATLLTSSLLLSSKASASICPEENTYDKRLMKSSKSGAACAGIRSPENDNAIDFEGDYEWINKDGSVKTIGLPPYMHKFVVTDKGTLQVYFDFPHVNVTFWNAETGELKICTDKKKEQIKVIDVKKAQVKFSYSQKEEWVAVQRNQKTKAYYADCRDSGGRRVYKELTGGDHETLRSYSSGDNVNNNLTHPDNYPEGEKIIGRDAIVNQIISSLQSNSVRSTMLAGPPGVGKTVIGKRLAYRIATGDAPEWTKDWHVYLIQIGKLTSKYKGESAQMLDGLLAASTGKKVVLFVDEIHQILNMTGVIDKLKTNLADGSLAIVGTLTDQSSELNKLRAADQAFMRRFNVLRVDEPNKEVLQKIYKGKMKDFASRPTPVVFDIEKHVDYVIEESKKKIATQYHPDLGLKLIDKVANSLILKRNNPDDRTPIDVSIRDIRYQLDVMSGLVSVQEGSKDMRSFEEKALDFKEDLRKVYVGNEGAVDAVAEAILRVAAGVTSGRGPAGNFLFVGPSGVGKTYLAEKTAELMFDGKYKMYGMGKFKSDSDINALFGAPAGYVGYDDGAPLIQQIQDHPRSVLNFDEIEKAHVDLYDTLYPLLDKGLIEGKGNAGVANFKNGFVFMTSNAGLELINAYDKQVLGIEDPYSTGITDTYEGDVPETPEMLKRMLKEIMIRDEVFGKVTPAFLGRTNLVVFHHLSPEDQEKMVKLEMKSAIKKSFNSRLRAVLEIDPRIEDYLIENGFDFHQGARFVRPLIEKFIIGPVAKVLTTEQIKNPDVEFEKMEIRIRGLQTGDPEAVAIPTIKE